MATIVTRAGKGEPLTHAEVDDNFTSLNADKLDASSNLSDVSSASAARTNLGLGTAATTASTDYATAAQGALADSAVQPADNISTLTNDAGYTTNVGDITGVNAGGGLSGGGTSGTVTISHADSSSLSGTYGSTAEGTKIAQISVDPNGHVTAITTGPTGDITGVTAGSGLTGGGTSGTVTVSIDIASQAEAEAGTNNTKVMTPLRVAQAIVASSALIVEEFVYNFAVSGAVSVVEFTDLSGFDYFDLESTLTTVGDSNGVMQFSPDNGVTYRTTGYIGGCVDGVGSSTITNGIRLTRTNVDHTLGSCRIIGMNDASVKTTASGVFNGGESRTTSTGGRYNTAEAHNALRVAFNTSVSQGVLKLRGYKFT